MLQYVRFMATTYGWGFQHIPLHRLDNSTFPPALALRQHRAARLFRDLRRLARDLAPQSIFSACGSIAHIGLDDQSRLGSDRNLLYVVVGLELSTWDQFLVPKDSDPQQKETQT